jgi:TRAP-type C4-dicarboxylate transport system permease small subunit
VKRSSLTPKKGHTVSSDSNYGKIMNLFLKIENFLPKLSVVIAGATLCFMALLVLAEVIARNLLSIGIPFAVEYSEYAVPIVGLVGAAYALNKGDHVSADLVITKVPRTARKWIMLIGYVLGLGLMILLASQSFIMAFLNIKMNALALYPTLTPLGYPQLAMGIGFSIFSMQLVIEIIRKAGHLIWGWPEKV